MRHRSPTCVNTVLQPHVMEVVVASLLVLLEGAALLVTPPTISTFVRFSHCTNKQIKKSVTGLLGNIQMLHDFGLMLYTDIMSVKIVMYLIFAISKIDSFNNLQCPYL